MSGADRLCGGRGVRTGHRHATGPLLVHRRPLRRTHISAARLRVPLRVGLLLLLLVLLLLVLLVLVLLVSLLLLRRLLLLLLLLLLLALLLSRLARHEPITLRKTFVGCCLPWRLELSRRLACPWRVARAKRPVHHTTSELAGTGAREDAG